MVKSFSDSAGTAGRTIAEQRSDRYPHKRLPGADRHTLPDLGAKRESFGSEHNNSRAMLEPAHLVAFTQRRVARECPSPRFAAAQHLVEKPQSDPSHQNSSNGHQRHRRATAGKPRPDHGALIFAEQPFDPLQRDRVDIPGVAGNMRDRLDAAVVRSVKPIYMLEVSRSVA
jgi:hypothetical protein